MNYNKDFIPAIEVIDEFNKKGTIPFNIMISRNNEIFYSYKINITDDIKESYYVVKKLILTLMWMVGGNHLFLNGSKELFNYLKKQETEDEELIASIDSLNKIFNDKFEITVLTNLLLFTSLLYVETNFEFSVTSVVVIEESVPALLGAEFVANSNVVEAWYLGVTNVKL